MRLTTTNLTILAVVPIILGLVIIINFWAAITILRPMGMTTSMVFDQMAAIGVAVFLGSSVYWLILIYYVHLLQENEVIIQKNFTQLAGSGTSHLEKAKNLIGKVLDDIKVREGKLNAR